MGYTDRTNANPEVPTQFSLITPPAKIGEALAQMPGAITQGANNFVSGVTAAPQSLPFNSVAAPSNSAAPNAQSVPQQQDPQPQQSIASNPVELPKAPVPSSTPQNPPSTVPTTGAVPKLSPFSIVNKLSPGNNTNTIPGTSTGTANPGGQLVNTVTNTLQGAVTGLLGGKHNQPSPSGTGTPSSSNPAG